MEFQLDRLPDDSVDVAEFGREDLGVLEFNEVIVVEPMFRHRRFVDVQAYVPALFFYSGLNRSDQSVRRTPGRTHRGCYTRLESSASDRPSQDGGSWRSSSAAGQHS